MTLSVLRAELPMFEWRGERCGFGWNYRGIQGIRSVLVQPYAFTSFGSDEFETRWMVREREDEGLIELPFFIIQERCGRQGP